MGEGFITVVGHCSHQGLGKAHGTPCDYKNQQTTLVSTILFYVNSSHGGITKRHVFAWTGGLQQLGQALRILCFLMGLYFI